MKNPIKELESTFECYVDNAGLPRRKNKVRTTSKRITDTCIILDNHLSGIYNMMPRLSHATMYRMIDECNKTCMKLFSTSYDYLWTQDFVMIFRKDDGTFAGVKLAPESYDRILILDKND